MKPDLLCRKPEETGLTRESQEAQSPGLNLPYSSPCPQAFYMRFLQATRTTESVRG